MQLTHVLYSEVLTSDEECVENDRHTSEQLEQVKHCHTPQLTGIYHT